MSAAMAERADRWEHTGAILCGGKSRRMGRPKAGIVLADGRTMIERVFDALGAVCREVVLVGAGDDVPPRLSRLVRIADRIADIGPLGGLEALLASGLDSEYLVAPCDLVEARPELFQLLLQPGLKPPVVLAWPDKAHPEPLIARYSTDVYELVQEMIREGHLAMRQLVRRSGAAIIPVPAELGFALRNANTPDDLQ